MVIFPAILSAFARENQQLGVRPGLTNRPVQSQKQARSCEAKTKELISFALTAKLICTFGFAYAYCWFYHEAANIYFVMACVT